MIIWLPAIGLLVFAILGIAGDGIRLTRRKTLHGRQAKIVGALCLAGGLLISPIGIGTIALLIQEAGHSRSRASTARASTTDSRKSSHSVPPPPVPPPPAPPTRRQNDSHSLSSSSFSRLPSPQPAAPRTHYGIVMFEVLIYDGQADPDHAAQAALKNVSWAAVDEMCVDLERNRVFIPLRTSWVDTKLARSALTQAGFQLGWVTVTAG